LIRKLDQVRRVLDAEDFHHLVFVVRDGSHGDVERGRDLFHPLPSALVTTRSREPGARSKVRSEFMPPTIRTRRLPGAPGVNCCWPGVVRRHSFGRTGAM